LSNILKREIIITNDGSTTIHIPEWNEQYHSKHGAIQESKHVFIEMGLYYYLQNNTTSLLNILEIGFGTGLNAIITLLESNRLQQSIQYTGVEAYPVEMLEIKKLNYSVQLNCSKKDYESLHQCQWEKQIVFDQFFSLEKRKQLFSKIEDKNRYHIIYFDAFGARVQPDLWTEHIFIKMYDALILGGVLVTYSAKGSVRRAMQSSGFLVERLPGPRGKREMLRATKV
jgi:tRNA U34 5-methylaminomethyl-2-thiouridine-forming methyltransferase MnmC